MTGITLVARNTAGNQTEFHLYEQERQYTIGGQADIALQSLDSNKGKKRITPVGGFITFIAGGWYFRSAKGHRRGTKTIKVNGKPVDASHAEIRIRHGYTISFGEDDFIVVQVYESVDEETLRDRVPELVGLFDQLKLEFETLNDEIRHVFRVDEKVNTNIIMSKLEAHGLFNAAYEYNMARGLRNIIAHPSPGIVRGIKRQYIYDSLQAIESVKKSLRELRKRSEA